MSVHDIQSADAVVVGGGFYGCCMALFLRSRYDRVVLFEAEDSLLSRASFVNQARVHTGFHYPRNLTTAKRSLALHKRFIDDFQPAVVDDFVMLYAIAKQGSKISAQRFDRMFHDLGAPLEAATPSEHALFNSDRIASVFRCREAAFDARIVRDLLADRMHDAQIDVRLNSRVRKIIPHEGRSRITLRDGSVWEAPLAVNASYGLFFGADVDARFSSQLKYELVEIALVEPPPDLRGYGVTVMDGPFFSIMPFPARGCYSLTHVRYTPHGTWHAEVPEFVAPATSNRLHMQRDAMRYMPCLADLTAQGSLFDIKTVLTRNEGDDGRPIFLFQDDRHPGYANVLGGKIDNTYDLFDVLNGLGREYADCDTRWVSGTQPVTQRAL